MVQRILRQHLRHFWPGVDGQRVLGLGYAVPYLKTFLGEAERVVALMPRPQGAVFWPADEKGLVGICEEGELPIETNSIDRMLVIHGFHGYESLDVILREAWRVLVGQGRLVLVVPNRTGVWARVDSTPFGHGTPFSLGQIRGTLKDYLFVPEKMERALFVPPTSSRLLLAMAPVWEKIGQRFFPAFGGVNIVEASKQLYAGTLVGATEPIAATRRRAAIPAGPVPGARVSH
ncbi:MAG: methyltransferase type 11 [Alphaproteobacteria bacterium]|nr:methyltransferase type 11 [Alphaproteobacteria bacterium]